MRKHPPLLFTFTMVFGLLFFQSTAFAATIRINAPKIQLELSPGETAAGEIAAENPTEESAKVKIYLEDWAYAPGGTGEKRFSPVASTPTSAAKWITFSPTDEILKPFGRTVVHYTITVPPDAKGAAYAVLFFETLLGKATDEEGASVNVAGRVGSLFFIEIKGSNQRKGEIKLLQIKAPVENKPLQIITSFQNTGSVDITLGGNFLIMDPDGKIKARGDLNKIYTFRNDTETGTTEWVGRLPKGNYQALITYDLGKGKNLVEEKVFKVE